MSNTGLFQLPKCEAMLLLFVTFDEESLGLGSLVGQMKQFEESTLGSCDLFYAIFDIL